MALFREPEGMMPNPFIFGPVYLSGEFLEEEKLRANLDKAELVKNITEAKIVIVGYNQPLSDVRELAKHKFWDGWETLTITEEFALKMLSSDMQLPKGWEKIVEPRRIDINITYDRLFNTIYSPIAHFTDDKGAPTLEGKEVFMFFPKGYDFKVDDPVKLFLEQQGAIVKDTFDPAKTDYCLLRESTLEQLKEGNKDDFIQAIEDGYNSSSCNKFPAEFILESEVLALMKRMGQE